MDVVGYSVKLQAWFRRDVRDWIAWSPAIDVKTQARTKKRALESLRQAVELWFESCIERRVLAEALEEVGFSKLRQGEIPQAGDDAVSVLTKKSVVQITETDHLSFTLGKGRGPDYIEGLIPAYIAADQLGRLGRTST